MLFKIFKSDFKLDKLKDLKVERIETHIYATLIRMLLLNGDYKGYQWRILKRNEYKASNKKLVGGFD